MPRFLLCLSLVLGGVFAACSGGGSGPATGTGGKVGTGGVVGSGGASSSGGAVGTGGAASGGAIGSGGVMASGGQTIMGSGGAAGAPDAGTADVVSGSGGASSTQDASQDQSSASGTTFVYVSGNTSTIRVYKLDLATGMLAASSMTTDGGNTPSYLAFHPNKKFLYAVNENMANSKLIAFSIDAGGALTKLAQNGEAATTPGQGPPHLSVHASGKWLYAAHYNSGHITVHTIMSNGGISTPIQSDKTANSEAHQAKQDPTGKFLLVPCRTPNYVAQYRLDDTTGMLTANSPARVTPAAGTGPRHMDFHPNGKWAYLIGELSGHVVSYMYDGTTGLLSSPEDLAILPSENAGAHILVHTQSGGQYVFVSLRQNNEITTLAVNASTGRLTVKAHQNTMIAGPRDFTIDPSGRYLLVANQTSGTVVVFEINTTDGTLTFRSSVMASGITQPSFVGALVLP